MAKNFGTEFDKEWPIKLPNYTEFGVNLLKQCIGVKPPEPLAIQELMDNSEKFPIPFPINTCRIKSQPNDRHAIIEQQAASSYPIVHERVLWLCTRFLEYKSKCGKNTQLYKNMSIIDLIDRLLSKRCVTFVGSMDYYKLLSGDSGFDCYGENNDRYANDHPLHINNLIGYDEVKLSAFLSISTHSEFINNGRRRNAGNVENDRNSHEHEGVVIGLIGPRFVRPNQMEYQDCSITKEQNIFSNGYGSAPRFFDWNTKKRDYRRMWNEFYDNENLLYSNCKIDEQRFDKCFANGVILDNVVLKKRYTIAFDTLLLDSTARAYKLQKKAYVHVVGIGLGVWLCAVHQEELFLRTFEQRIKYLLPQLKNIGWIHFSWFNRTECGELTNGNRIYSADNENGIKIFISKRNPADKLIGNEFKDSLIISSFAWDANAFPGNEFWDGSLESSSDPAAACSTLITELYNPYINKTMISGNNLHIASVNFGVIHLADYVKKII